MPNVREMKAADIMHKGWTDPLRLDSFSGEVRMPAEENRRDHGRAEEVLSGIQAAGGGGAAQWSYNSGAAQAAMIYGIMRDKERLDAGEPTEHVAVINKHQIEARDRLAAALSKALLRSNEPQKQEGHQAN